MCNPMNGSPSGNTVTEKHHVCTLQTSLEVKGALKELDTCSDLLEYVCKDQDVWPVKTQRPKC